MGTTTPPGRVSADADDERTSIDTSPPVHPVGTYPPGRLSQVIDLRPGTLVGEYEINGKLGQGGMGVVYSATHPVIGKKAAVKVLKKNLCADVDAVERFIQEARAVNQIGHPNIVDIFAFGELEDGRSYLVMELLTGESLQSRLRRAPLGRDELCHYVDAIARALEAAHDKRIIHRDLKPENVFLHELRGERPIVKLLDFGIAKLADTDDNRTAKTRTGSMMGTPQYISPEQARGYAIDHRADIYSLGVMLFEMLAGRPPFVSDNSMDMVAKHLYETPPRIAAIVPDVPAVLDELVAQLLDKDATRRPSLARVRAVLDEVRRLPEGDSGYTSPEVPVLPGYAAAIEARPSVETTIRGPARRPVGLYVAIGVAVAGAVVTFAVVKATRDEPDAAGPTRIAEPAPAPLPPVAQPQPGAITPPGTELAPPIVAPSAPAAPGWVKVRLLGGRGELFVDGVAKDGRRVWELALAPGTHELELRVHGQEPWKKTVEVKSGESQILRVGERRRPGSGEPAGEDDDDLMMPGDGR